MNAAHLHLVLNQIPVIALPVILIFLLYFHRTQNQAAEKFTLKVLIFFSLLVIPTFLTGEPAKNMIEDFPTINDKVLEPHEEAAQIALLLSAVTFVLAAVYLFIFDNVKLKKPIFVVLSVFLGAVVLTLFYTANLGAKIRHTEIRNVNQNFKIQ